MNESEKASENFKKFIIIINKLFKEDKINFDLLIGAGDSGIAMTKIASLVLEEIGVPPTRELSLPYFRFKEKHVPRGEVFDNAALSEEIKNVISNQKLTNILFVDDEINRARALSGIIELIKKINTSALSSDTRFYVVAENHGFSENLIPAINVEFMPFGNKTEGMNNVIFGIVPPQLKNKLKEEYGEFYKAELVCVLLNLPVKEIKDGKPCWSKDLLNDVKSKVPDLEKYQKEFEIYIRNFIKENL